MIATNQRQHEAIHLLQNPELHGKLIPRKRAERRLNLWRLPSVDAYTSWSIFKPIKENEYWVRRLEFDPHGHYPIGTTDSHILGAEAILPVEAARCIFKNLLSIRAPMFEKPEIIGIDGVFFGIEFGNFWQNSRIGWWSQTSSSWAELQKYFDTVVKITDAYLPPRAFRSMSK